MRPAASETLAERAHGVGALVAEAFASVTRGVSAVRAASGEAGALVETLVGAVAAAERPAAADGGAGPAARLEEAAAAAAALVTHLADAELVEACGSLETRLDEAKLAAKELGVISMMTKIAMADSAWNRADAENYTRTLDDLTARLQEVVAAARARARPIVAQRRAAAEEIAAAAAALEGARARVVERSDAAAALLPDRDACLAALRGDAERLGPALAEPIARLVPCLQFADALNQRIDHAVRILDAAGAPDAEARAAAPRIAAAQMGALARDCAAIHADAGRALERLDAAAETHEAALLRRDAEPLRRWLDAEAAVSETAAEATGSALAHLGRAETRMEAVVESASKAATSIAAFRGLIVDLDIAACNATVASARHSQRAGVLNYLAGSVAEASKRCAGSLHACAATLARIEERLPTEEQQRLAERLDALAGEQDAAAAAAEAQRETLARQAEARAGLEDAIAALRAAARDSLDAIAEGRANDAALGAIAAELDDAAAAPPRPEALAWATALYTTTAERETHAALAPAGAGAAPRAADGEAAEAADDDAELEGFLL